jgi:peptidoglycan/LPS O-acetylase OafA/YrhL
LAIGILEDIVFWTQRLPFLSLSALGAYAILAAFLVPRCRQWLSARLVMPVPSTGIHLAPLDAFRGLAALLIVLYHCAVIPRPIFDETALVFPAIRLGDKAVPIFCVLSGFLIYRSLRKVTTTGELRSYVRRRILRVYPLYVASVAVCVILGPLTIYRALGEVFMLQVLEFRSLSNPVIWSLYVEVAFYAILPVIVCAVDSRGMPAFGILAFLVLSLADIEGPRTFALWKYFVAGILASELADRYLGNEGAWMAPATFVFGLFLLVLDFHGIDWVKGSVSSVLRLAPSRHVDSSTYTVGLALASLLMVAGSVATPLLAKFFAWSPFRILGAISYSIFVWHGFIVCADFPLHFDTRGQILEDMPGGLQTWPVAPYWLALVVPVPAVVFWAVLSFILIERPFLLRRPK